MNSNQIVVDLKKFLDFFPEFDGITEDELNSAYAGANSTISTHYGEIVLSQSLQERGVYLAVAHALYLRRNPSAVSQGAVASASEGSVSASFSRPQYKNWFEYWLSLSPYGIELLALLSQVQPPLPRRPLNTYPYYGSGFCV